VFYTLFILKERVVVEKIYGERSLESAKEGRKGRYEEINWPATGGERRNKANRVAGGSFRN
jgi:hypothetical protein